MYISYYIAAGDRKQISQMERTAVKQTRVITFRRHHTQIRYATTGKAIAADKQVPGGLHSLPIVSSHQHFGGKMAGGFGTPFQSR